MFHAALSRGLTIRLSALLFLLLAAFAVCAQAQTSPDNDEDMVLFYTDDEGTSYYYNHLSVQRDASRLLVLEIAVARSEAAARAFMRQARKRYMPYYTYTQTVIDCQQGRFLHRELAHFTADQTLAEQGSGNSWLDIGEFAHMRRIAGIVCAQEAPRARPQPTPREAPPAPGREAIRGATSSGTGFVITNDGMLLTNWHVAANARRLTALHNGKRYPLALQAYDAQADLALLSSSIPARAPVAFRAGQEARHGEDVITLGYPMPDVLSLDISTTTGIISSLAGVGNDPRHLQFTAPIQPGDSGGPLLDRYGSVVGVIVAKLDALSTAQRTRDIPQNVNFAIKASVVRDFLNRSGVRHYTLAPAAKRDVEDVVAAARNAVVLIINER